MSASPRSSASRVGIEQRDRNAGVGKTDRDAAAHRARADHAGVLHRTRLRLGGQAGNAACFALGKESVHGALRLDGLLRTR